MAGVNIRRARDSRYQQTSKEGQLMRLISSVIAVALVIVVTPTVESQSALPAHLDKKQVVTIVLPSPLFSYEGTTFTGSEVVMAKFIEGPGGTLVPVSTEPDWMASGFPSMLEVNFNKIGKKGADTEVEYKSKTGTTVRFRFPNGLLPGGLAPYMTVGDQPYLSVELESDGNVYNTLRLNESQLVRDPLHPDALSLSMCEENRRESFLRGTFRSKRREPGGATDPPFAAPLKGAGVYGVSLNVKISHKDFSVTYAPASDDTVVVYAPADLIRKFADADMTGQQFVDGCVVIVDGNRVQVNLSITGN